MLAKWVVDQATAGKQGQEDDSGEGQARKEAARLLGSRGGKKGGKARAEKLSPERRTEIARKAAKARWGTDEDAGDKH